MRPFGALAGKTLRSEVYALDGTADESRPYTVSEATFAVRLVQERGINRFGVYMPVDRESLAYHYERAFVLDEEEEEIEDPRVAHSVVLEIDEYGTPLRNASVVYPRRGSPTLVEQGKLYVTLSESEVVHLTTDADVLRLAVPVEARSYELHNLAAPEESLYRVTQITAHSASLSRIGHEFCRAG